MNLLLVNCVINFKEKIKIDKFFNHRFELNGIKYYNYKYT